MLFKKQERKRAKKKKRVSGNIHGTALRPRLSVFRSSRHIYVQAINDDAGATIGEASSLSADIKGACSAAKKIEAAKMVGALLACRLRDSGVEMVVFDRGVYVYHGRIKALADAAREAGLRF